MFDMIDFPEGANLNEALLMTMGAFGMAFLVLVTLMVVTIVMGGIVKVHSRKPSTKTSSEVSGHAMAAAIAVSIATAGKKQMITQDASNNYVPTELESGNWRNRGRQEIMDSRLDRVHRK